MDENQRDVERQQNERSLHNPTFSLPLLAWYHHAQRDFPWRKSSNPYHIWVSEVMLQQTRVHTAIPYYERFIALFPDVVTLAKAPEQAVLTAWAGLGYYARVRHLHQAAQQVVSQHDGVIPDKMEAFRSLKGVGAYTAGAVMSIAFHQRASAVDGNVMRVFSRYFGIYEDIAKNTTRVAMERLQYDLIPEGNAATFNQALMEFGALVCTPKTPSCDTCPLQKNCIAFARKCVHELPLKSKAKRPVVEKRWVALLVRAEDGCILFRQRPPEGLLANMWELPHQLHSDKQQSEGEYQIFECPYANISNGVSHLTLHPTWREQLGFSRKTMEYAPHDSPLTVEHYFSHIHWHMTVFAYVLSGARIPPLLPTYRWIHPKETSMFPLPTVFQRIIAHDFHHPHTKH